MPSGVTANGRYILSLLDISQAVVEASIFITDPISIVALVTENSETVGEALHTSYQALLTGAALTQDFAPLKNVCAHLNAFHAYASDPSRLVEAIHYCGHLTDGVRQCILYDSSDRGARIIGIEYMITPEVYPTLNTDGRKLWRSHVYEVKPGMLVMPQPMLPDAAWDVAESGEMDEVVRLYGKAFHLWHVDTLPLGCPELMMSFTADGQVDFGRHVSERDRRLGTDYARKQDVRRDVEDHPDADQAWKRGWGTSGSCRKQYQTGDKEGWIEGYSLLIWASPG